MGMPADDRLPEDKHIRIQSIALKGNGLFRVLKPEKEEFNPAEYVTSRTDFCLHGYFYFFGVPAGEYEVVVTAKNFAPATEKFYSTPGENMDYQVIELTAIEKNKAASGAPTAPPD